MNCLSHQQRQFSFTPPIVLETENTNTYRFILFPVLSKFCLELFPPLPIIMDSVNVASFLIINILMWNPSCFPFGCKRGCYLSCATSGFKLCSFSMGLHIPNIRPVIFLACILSLKSNFSFGSSFCDHSCLLSSELCFPCLSAYCSATSRTANPVELRWISIHSIRLSPSD